MPMMAARPSGKFTLASSDDSPPTTFLQDLVNGESEITLQHRVMSI